MSTTSSSLLFILHSDFISLKDIQELLIVDSSLVFFPEVINEAFKSPLVYSQIQFEEDIFEVFAGDYTIASAINHFEERCHIHVCALGGFHHLVNDRLIRASVSNSKSFKLTNEFMVANTSTLVIV